MNFQHPHEKTATWIQTISNFKIQFYEALKKLQMLINFNLCEWWKFYMGWKVKNDIEFHFSPFSYILRRLIETWNQLHDVHAKIKYSNHKT